MSRLVEDLLDVSRVSRGLVQLEKAPVKLAEVVAAAKRAVALRFGVPSFAFKR